MLKRFFLTIVIVLALTASPINAYADTGYIDSISENELVCTVVGGEAQESAKPALCGVSARTQSAMKIKSAKQQRMPKAVKANPMAKGLRF